jgi:hypothetical protein
MSLIPAATILCIDDNETALKVRKMALEVAGYSVLTASDVDLAMQLFTTSDVDIVMSDHLLQGKTGTAPATYPPSVIPKAELSGHLQSPVTSPAQRWSRSRCASPKGWLFRGEWLQRSLTK